jgi:DNA-binding NtrC family response regulator
MGVTPRERSLSPTHIAMSEAGSMSRGAAPVQHRGASASYAIGVADASGHMRKLEELEAEIIRMAITRYHGRMSEVARRLGIGRSTLYRKLKDLGLETEASEAEEGSEDPLRAAAG